MNVVVIDGPSGRMGQMFIERATAANLPCQITAVGTNAIATSAMLKAGAEAGATGENPVLVACRTADVIVGPIGILAADSLMGEITPTMAVAIGRSDAKKLLLPVNHCNNLVAGTQALSLSRLMDEAVELLRSVLQVRQDDYEALDACLREHASSAAEALLENGVELDGYLAWAAKQNVLLDTQAREILDRLAEQQVQVNSAPEQNGPVLGGMSL